MTILVTNDDGIGSSGIQALARKLARLGTVWVIAPDRERTAVGHALTLHKPLRLTPVKPRWFAVNGTPTDCVNLAVKHVLRRPPTLVVSGVNRGVNLGDDVTYSGTVSAALEGAILGIPSIAVSQDGRDRFFFEAAADYALVVARAVLRHGLPPGTLLNVNVPNRPRAGIKGIRVTRLSRRRFENPIIEKTDPRGRKYYWIAGTRITWTKQADSDYAALRRGFVSVTPLHLDMTNEEALEALQQWDHFRRLGSSQGSRAVRGGTPVRTR
ncbi:5'-nucleotidase SurE [Nitrospira tepida]|uniref:5'-nucleotidase SurE n=1 Tax=Nitrospira tepida TaxID=2973512 RepID=A0AA86N2X8_9BACT|nr:5'-nucleotidase SurE [Nitrospira tepida]